MIFYGSPYRRMPSTMHPFEEKPVKKTLFWSVLLLVLVSSPMSAAGPASAHPAKSPAASAWVRIMATLVQWLAPVTEKARGSIDPWGTTTSVTTDSTQTDARGSIDPWGGS
jgi:hypothetical protein